MIDVDKKNFIKKLICSGIVIIIVLCLAYYIFNKLGLTKISQEELQTFISSTGVVAPLIYILITFLQVVLIPMPSVVMILVGNYLFGTFFSFLYSYIGLIVGSIVAYLLGKLIGRPFINWLSGGQKQTDMWISKLKGKEKVLLFFMFLFPMFPDDVLCAIAGILPITYKEFVFIQIITRFTTVATTLIFMTGEIIPFNGWGIPIIALGVLICLITFIYCFKNADKFDFSINKKKNKTKETNNKEENVSNEDI